MKRLPLALAAAMLLPTAGLAQLAASGGESGSARQVSQEDSTARPIRLPHQIHRDIDRTSFEPQLSPVSASREPPQQLGAGPRSVEVPRGSSPYPRERTAIAEPIGGKDSCDPVNSSAPRAALCCQVIEERRSDFEREEREPSPEQRLLREGEPAPATEAIAGAARRLQTSGEAGNSLSALGLASIVLAPGKPEQKREDQKDDFDADKAAQAVQAIASQPH